MKDFIAIFISLCIIDFIGYLARHYKKSPTSDDVQSIVTIVAGYYVTTDGVHHAIPAGATLHAVIKNPARGGAKGRFR